MNNKSNSLFPKCERLQRFSRGKTLSTNSWDWERSEYKKFVALSVIKMCYFNLVQRAWNVLLLLFVCVKESLHSTGLQKNQSTNSKYVKVITTLYKVTVTFCNFTLLHITQTLTLDRVRLAASFCFLVIMLC